MLDCSPKKIKEYSEHYGYEFWQLRTPLTQNAVAGVPYGMDNGAFSGFRESAFMNMVDAAHSETDKSRRPLWVCSPDIVGDAQRTVELLHVFKRKIAPLPIALVLQNGIGGVTIPWDLVSAVFVGGDDRFKTSRECLNTLSTAAILHKKIHIGRVNSARRVRDFMQAEKDYNFKVDSIDGSGMSRFDERLEVVLDALRNPSDQPYLFGDAA